MLCLPICVRVPVLKQGMSFLEKGRVRKDLNRLNPFHPDCKAVCNGLFFLHFLKYKFLGIFAIF